MAMIFGSFLKAIKSALDESISHYCRMLTECVKGTSKKKT